eukprot:765654-Amorphochlora_amoeboformis.AAC.1
MRRWEIIGGSSRDSSGFSRDFSRFHKVLRDLSRFSDNPRELQEVLREIFLGVLPEISGDFWRFLEISRDLLLRSGEFFVIFAHLLVVFLTGFRPILLRLGLGLGLGLRVRVLGSGLGLPLTLALGLELGLGLDYSACPRTIDSSTVRVK